MIGEEVIAIWDDGIDGAELYEVQKLVRCKDCKWHTSDDECIAPKWDFEERVVYPTTYSDRLL